MKLKIIKPRRPVPSGPSAPPADVKEKIVEYGLLALLIFSPLPAASVYEWSIFIIGLTVLVMAGAYIASPSKPRVHPELAGWLRRLRYPAIGFFAFLVFQVIPLPKFLLGWLSPGTLSFLERFFPGFSAAKFASVSIAPGRTLREALELLTCFLLAYLVFRVVRHGSQVKRIYAVLIGLGVFEAFYGLFELTAKTPRILFEKKLYNLDSVTGTFVNRNHLSGYLEMIVPLALGLIIARADVFSLGGKGLRDRILYMAGRGLAVNVLLALAVLVMSLGIVFSRSRSGIFILALTFLLFLEAVVFHFGRRGFRRIWVRNFIIAVMLTVVFVALYVGVGASIQRFSLDKLLQENRPLYWSNMTRTIGDFPLFGTGLGTFVSAYPAYEELGGPEIVLDHAHNDYLEYLSELGIVGASLIFGLIFAVIIVAWMTWRKRNNPEVRGLALGGLVSLAAILLHSLTDFNLHIPANRLLFSAILPLTLVTAFLRKR